MRKWGPLHLDIGLKSEVEYGTGLGPIPLIDCIYIVKFILLIAQFKFLIFFIFFIFYHFSCPLQIFT